MSNFQQTDTTPASPFATVAVKCSGAQVGTTAFIKVASDGGTPGSTGITPKLSNPNTGRILLQFAIDPDDAWDWETGNASIAIRTTTGNANLTWVATYLCRCNGSTGANIETYGSKTAQSIGMGGASTKTMSAISCTTVTPNAGDVCVVSCIFDGPGGHGNETMVVVPDQLCIVPINAAGVTHDGQVDYSATGTVAFDGAATFGGDASYAAAATWASTGAATFGGALVLAAAATFAATGSRGLEAQADYSAAATAVFDGQQISTTVTYYLKKGVTAVASWTSKVNDASMPPTDISYFLSGAEEALADDLTGLEVWYEADGVLIQVEPLDVVVIAPPALAGGVTHNAQVDYAAAATVAFDGAATYGGSVDYSAAATAAFTGSRGLEAQADWSTAATFAATGEKVLEGSIAFASVGTVAFAAGLQSDAQVDWSALATASFTGERVLEGQVDWSALATAVFAGGLQSDAQVDWSAAATASFDGTVGSIHDAQVDFSAVATALFDGAATLQGDATWAAAATASFAAGLQSDAQVDWSATATAFFDGQVAGVQDAQVDFSAAGTVVFGAGLQSDAQVDYSAVGTFAASGAKTLEGSATYDAQATVGFAGEKILQGAITYDALGVFSVAGGVSLTATWGAQAQATVSLAGVALLGGEVDFSGLATFTADGDTTPDIWSRTWTFPPSDYSRRLYPIRRTRTLEPERNRVLAAVVRLRTLEIGDMNILPAFDPKRSSEVDVFAFDLKNILDTGELPTGVPTFTVEVSSASKVADSSPGAMVSDPATIQSTKILQKLIDGVDGALYVVIGAVGTDGGRTLEVRGLLKVEDPSA